MVLHYECVHAWKGRSVETGSVKPRVNLLEQKRRGEEKG